MSVKRWAFLGYDNMCAFEKQLPSEGLRRSSFMKRRQQRKGKTPFSSVACVHILRSDCYLAKNQRDGRREYRPKYHYRELRPIDQSCALVLGVYPFFLSNRISQQLCPWAIVLPRVNTKSSKTLAIPRSPFMAMSHRTSISSLVQPSFCQASTNGQ